MKTKKPAYGGDNPFNSPEEYADFARKYHVFGNEAIALAKKMSIPEPKIRKKK